MLKRDVKIGRYYTAMVSNNLVTVRIDEVNRFGGWHATNMRTNRKVHIKSAQKLREDVTRSKNGNGNSEEMMTDPQRDYIEILLDQREVLGQTAAAFAKAFKENTITKSQADNYIKKLKTLPKRKITKAAESSRNLQAQELEKVNAPRRNRATGPAHAVKDPPHHEWYVLVKISDDVDKNKTALEFVAQDVADSVYPPNQVDTAHVVFDDGNGHYVRPNWAKDHKVES